MPKQRKSRLELEALALAELRKVAGCEEATSVTIHALADPHVEETWYLSHFIAGRSNATLCAAALRPIEASLQEMYDLADDPVRPMPRRLWVRKKGKEPPLDDS